MEAQYNVVAFGRHHFLPDNIPRNPLSDFSRIIGSIHRIQYIISLAIMAIYEFMPLLNNNSWPVVLCVELKRTSSHQHGKTTHWELLAMMIKE